MGFYSQKEVLVTGGTGLAGKQLTQMLLEQDAKVTVVSLDDPSRAPQGSQFVRADLRELSNCLEVCEGKEIVFHLAGVKGSPKMTAEKPASFFVPTIMFNTNVMEAARRCNVSRFLYTSSIGVYEPAEVFYEDNVWSTFPSPNDRHAGWAKRMGELQADAYLTEYGWDKISIVRPAAIYGPGDNFDPKTAMVIPALISRAMSGENPLVAWGDGSPVRDYIHSRDVARGMMLAVEKGVNVPVNLGSGTGVTIKELTQIIASNVPGGPIEIDWDTSKPNGDLKRVMDVSRARKLLGFNTTVSLEEGIRETMLWYQDNIGNLDNRYNPFYEFKRPGPLWKFL